MADNETEVELKVIKAARSLIPNPPGIKQCEWLNEKLSDYDKNGYVFHAIEFFSPEIFGLMIKIECFSYDYEHRNEREVTFSNIGERNVFCLWPASDFSQENTDGMIEDSVNRMLEAVESKQA